MKLRIMTTLLAACLLVGQVQAQTIIEAKQVSLDSLVKLMRKEINPHTYYIKNNAEVSKFTVRATSEDFIRAASTELGRQGYVMSSYDDGIYILKGKSIFTSLPNGYFQPSKAAQGTEALQKYLAEQSQTVTYQNKVYEIGDPLSKRSGKVYISGRITDTQSGEPLVGVSVFDMRSGAYTISDNSGFYRILMNTGDGSLNFSAYSCDELKLSLKVHDNGTLDVQLKEKVTALKGVVVSADAISHHRNSDMGLERIHIETVSKVPTAFGETDLIKAMLTLPGVKSVGEASSGFNVRGGSTDQNLILFNGSTIFNPSHLFGLFFAFNSDVISGIELYKCSIPAEFGGRISSVLEVRNKEGNSNKLTGSLGLGLLTSRFHLEGPIAKGKTTFILGSRTTYSDWLLNLIPENQGYSGGTAGFSDLNLGISHKLNENNTIQAFTYWSHDRFSFSNDTTFRYSNLNASVRWRSNFSTNHSLEASAGYDSYKAELQDDFNPMSGYDFKTGLQQVFSKAVLKSSINDVHALKYGLNLIYIMLDPGTMKPLQSPSLVMDRKLKEETGLEPSLFLSDNIRLSSKVSLDGGVRLTGFLPGGKSKFHFSPEIRMAGKYSILDNLSLKAGFNTMTQFIHLITNTTAISPVDSWRLSSNELKPQKGWQAASGAYWTLTQTGIDLSVEGYYKHMSNYLDYKSGAILTMNDHIADDLVGTYGKAYGVEFMARKNSGKLTGWLSYTWSRSFLREMEDRGIESINSGRWYRAPHDKPHDIKLVGNYKFTHRYSLSFNLDYSTGRPVTIPIGWYNYGGGKRLAYSERNGYRIPDYFRLDMAMNIEPGHYMRQLTHMSMTFGVHNVTGRKNAYSVYYTTNSGSSIKGNMLCVFACPIPYINLNLKF